MRTTRTWAASVLLAVSLCPLRVAKAGEGERAAHDTYRNLRQVAMEEVDAGLKRLDEIVRRRSEPKKKHEEIWEQTWTEFIGTWRMKMSRIDIKLQEEQKDPAEHQAWREPYQKFLDEIRGDGYRILYWRGKLWTDKYFLQSDIDDFKDKTDHLVRNMDELEKALDAADDVLYDDKTKTATIDKHLREMELAVRLASSIGHSLRVDRDSIEKHHGIETPKLAKDVDAILKKWEAAQESYPGVMQRWTAYLGEWAKIQRKDWKDFLAVRKKFDTVYAPVIKQAFFDDRKRFKGLKFTDYAAPVEKMRTELRAWRLKVQNKEKELAEFRRALEEEKRISAEERKRYDEINAPFGPIQERELRLASARAAGGASRVRELKILHARAEPGSDEDKALLEQIEDLENGRHPEQIAAEKALADYRKAEEEAIRKSRKIMAERKRRRAKLGLSADWD
jgi:hypothetical protein